MVRVIEDLAGDWRQLDERIESSRSLWQDACCRQIKLLQIDFDSRWLSRSHYPTMSLTRPIVFWIAMLAALIAAVVLLREVLLPFVAGMVLAYLLDPLATRLERLGMNRLIATLTIVGLFIVGVVALIVLTAPIIVRELAYFVDSFPLYIRPLHGLATSPLPPCLTNILRNVL